ncbi:MAG: hypothetical protein B7C54_06180 [Acidimicrobiales bacterium mtb01]|nr:hypothetical protein [Actinomycetota bacterium]TEX46776.1 MAG: hypothetical protein B7C54_06180 [Acidimicrobiales bacterium mtb01]
MRVSRDRGSSTVELVILVPALVLLVLVSIHTVMFFYSSHIAQAAAARGAAVGSSSTSSVAATVQRARESATSFVAEVNSAVVGVPTVEVTDREIRVTVEIDVPDIMPFIRSTVRRTAIEPRELVVPEVSR